MERKLASIQIISNLESIPGADNIEKATVLGWQLVVRKGEFKIGDSCVYVEIDSIVPERPEFEFLRPRKFKIKTIKLKGQISQGIAFPISILVPSFLKKIPPTGTDVTSVLSIIKADALDEPMPNVSSCFHKWGRLLPSFIYKLWFNKLRKYFFSKSKSKFPPVPKTDEIRIQAVPQVLERHRGKLFYISEKLDGSSITCSYYKGKFVVASRNLPLKKDLSNRYWMAVSKLGIENKLKIYSRNIALQGELVGQGVQGNKYKISGYKIYFFNAFDIDQGRYVDFEEFIKICTNLRLETVPILSTNVPLDGTIPDLVKQAMGRSIIANTQREGLVFRPMKEERDEDLGRLSFKVINPEFLLKYDA